jgi:thiol-disulfide isomerase/thioredoxin
MSIKKTVVSLILAIALLFLAINSVSAKNNSISKDQYINQQTDTEKLVIYFFWGDGCPHCAAAKPVFQALASNNPSIDLKMYEIYYVEENQNLFALFGERYGMTPRYIPTIFIGDQYWEGWSDEIQADVLTAVNNCLKSGCTDKGADLAANTGELTVWTTEVPTTELEPTLEPTVAPTIEPTFEPTKVSSEPSDAKTIKLPLIGEVNLSHESLFVSTLLISFVDGFNPCSIWVLSMLLAITLHTGSRKKVLLIGLIFLTVTALIYALFIAGLFTVFTVVSFVGWIEVVVALVALFFSLVNIKDYFWYKEGVSLTISEKEKPGLFQRMRKVLEAGDSTWGLIGGTIVLAAGVSLVEFSCTAGFPVLWTNLLTSQHVPVITFILLLLVYMFIYQIDELGIFIAAVVSLKSNKMEEKHGRILKLIGGVLMLSLAIVMLVKPSLMSDIGQSMIVFGIAFGVTLLILLVHRVILPKMGIHIGTEFQKNKKKKKR